MMHGRPFSAGKLSKKLSLSRRRISGSTLTLPVSDELELTLNLLQNKCKPCTSILPGKQYGGFPPIRAQALDKHNHADLLLSSEDYLVHKVKHPLK